MNPPTFFSLVIGALALAATATPSLVRFDVPGIGSIFVVAFSFAPASSTQRSKRKSIPLPSLLSSTTVSATITGFARDQHRGHAGLYPLHTVTNKEGDGGDDDAAVIAEESTVTDDKYSDDDEVDNLQQLQKRFEDAMKRRDERLSRMEKSHIQGNTATSSSDPTSKSLIGIGGDEQVKSFIGGASEGNSFTSDLNGGVFSRTTESSRLEKDDESDFNNDPDLTHRSSRRQDEMNDDDMIRPSTSSVRSSAMRNDWREYDDDTERQSTDPYFESPEKYVYRYPGYDDPYDDDEYYYDDTERDATQPSEPSSFQWESYRSTSILFPPLSRLSENRRGNRVPPTRPTAIIHFVGGTFFGSYPRKFYGSLLEDIARLCNAVVVATPIPLVLPGRGLVNQVGNWIFDEGSSGSYEDAGRERRKRGGSDVATNPLDHLSLSTAIQKEFNNAYRDVILDEYCRDYDNDKEIEDFMKNVPIVGIGHSLGARIQAVSCSHPHVSKRYLSMGKGNRLIRSGREGMIYLGFANWGASSSIPGVATLDQTVKRREQRRDMDQQNLRGVGVGRREDVWDNRSRRKRQDSMYGNDVRGRNGRYDRHDADDLELADVFGDILSSVAKGAKQIGEAITPQSEDLEFSPTPNELWDNLSAPNGWYSRSCRNNLIVQFEDDPIDQGSRLARTLLAAYNTEPAEKNSTSSVEDVHKEERMHTVKFARLSGGHLTPVTLHGGIAGSIPRGIVSLLSSSYNFILQQLVDGRMETTSKRQQKEVKDVVDSVATYIQALKCDN